MYFHDYHKWQTKHIDLSISAFVNDNNISSKKITYVSNHNVPTRTLNKKKKEKKTKTKEKKLED